MRSRLADGDGCGLLQRVTIDTGADGRETDGAHPALLRHRQTLAVTRSQQLRLATLTTAIDRSHGVKHVLRRQTARSRGDRLARAAKSDDGPYGVEFAHNLRAAGAMDGAIHAAAARQRGIGRVDDGVHCHPCDIAFPKNDFPSACAHPFHTIHYNRFVTRRELLLAGAVSTSALWARSHWDRSRISAITDELGNTADEAVDFAEANGLQCVEVRNRPGSNKEYAALREADMQADGMHFANERLKVSCVDTSLLKFAWPGTQPALPASEEPDQRDKRIAADTARWDRRMDDLGKALRCAQIMGCDKVRIFAGSRVADPSALTQRIAETIGAMALEAERQKIILLVENDAATNVATCAEVAGLLKLLPSKWVGVNWNPHGAYRLEKPFPAGYALLPKKRILNVCAEAGTLMPGSAEFEDWKAILTALDRDGYSGRVALKTGATNSERTALARDALDQLGHIIREVS